MGLRINGNTPAALLPAITAQNFMEVLPTLQPDACGLGTTETVSVSETVQVASNTPPALLQSPIPSSASRLDIPAAAGFQKIHR